MQVTKKQKSDQEITLVKQVAQGQIEAFEALLRAYVNPIYHFVLAYIYDFEEAQRIFLLVWKNFIQQIGWQPTDFRSDLSRHLYSMARDICLIEIKHNSALRCSAPSVFNEDGATKADKTLEYTERFVDSLSLRSQEIWICCIIQGLNYADMAFILNARDFKPTTVSDLLNNYQEFLNANGLVVSLKEGLAIYRQSQSRSIGLEPDRHLINKIRAAYRALDFEQKPSNGALCLKWIFHIKTRLSKYKKGHIALLGLALLVFYQFPIDLTHLLHKGPINKLETEYAITIEQKNKLQTLYLLCESLYTQKAFTKIIALTEFVMVMQYQDFVISLLRLRMMSFEQLGKKEMTNAVKAKLAKMEPPSEQKDYLMFND